MKAERIIKTEVIVIPPEPRIIRTEVKVIPPEPLEYTSVEITVIPYEPETIIVGSVVMAEEKDE